MGSGHCPGQDEDSTRVSGEARQVSTMHHQHGNSEKQCALGKGSLHLLSFTVVSLLSELTPIVSSLPPDVVPIKRAGDYRRIRQMTSSGQPSAILRLTANIFRPTHVPSSSSPRARVPGGAGVKAVGSSVM